MQRYFVDKSQVNNNCINIIGNDCHHITKVMRMHVGDKIICCDSEISYLCIIESFENDAVYTKIIETLNETKELPVDVTIAQGVVRREKMEEVIDKITQLGANVYQPVVMERCNVKFNDEKLDRKLERMNKIAKEASEQSHRTALLKVKGPISFNDFLDIKADLRLFAYEGFDKDVTIKSVLSNMNYKSILVLVGPEGGISEKEVKLLIDNNFIPVALGPRILRTEVAPTYILSAISYEMEN